MKVTEFHESEDGQKLYSVKLGKKELAKYFSSKRKGSFQEFKDKYQSPLGLPFGFRDEQGRMIDGRIKAETEEEYNKKAIKMMEDYKKSMKK